MQKNKDNGYIQVGDNIYISIKKRVLHLKCGTGDHLKFIERSDFAGFTPKSRMSPHLFPQPYL